jgi:hypothetical protein
MTQTPASGPFALVTRPPMSSLSMLTPPVTWRAPAPTRDAAMIAAKPAATMAPDCSTWVVFMFVLLSNG